MDDHLPTMTSFLLISPDMLDGCYRGRRGRECVLYRRLIRDEVVE